MNAQYDHERHLLNLYENVKVKEMYQHGLKNIQKEIRNSINSFPKFANAINSLATHKIPYEGGVQKYI